MSGRDFFLDAMRRRYACKKFDAERQLSDADVEYILECARLTPSSFGLEHWQLYAARTSRKIADLCGSCFGQEAVGTAALVVVAVCRRGAAYSPDGDFVRERGSRFPGGLSVFLADYRGYWEFLEREGLVDHWARSQCYLACANMMTGAAAAGIDSCAIEGFDNGATLSVLGLDPASWETGIITVFGHGDNAGQREKIRMPYGALVQYV